MGRGFGGMKVFQDLCSTGNEWTLVNFDPGVCLYLYAFFCLELSEIVPFEGFLFNSVIRDKNLIESTK